MKRIMHFFKLASLAASFLVLFSCGGGSGGLTLPPGSALYGTAAAGAPIVDGIITVICAEGVTRTTTTGNTGAWQLVLYGQTLPCAVELSGGTINGVTNTTTYHSIALTAGTVNVSPLTDLLVANLMGTSNPGAWFGGLSSPSAALAAITQARVNTALANMSAAFPALIPLGTHNPITTVFTATAGNASDDMLTALAKALATNTAGVTYASLLTNAAASSFTTPAAGFGTALTTAFSNTVSGGGSAYSIGGTVSGAVSSGVRISLTGSSTATTTTGAGGTYTLPGLYNGSYTVTPSLAGYTFSPTRINVTVNGANVTNRNFTSAVSTAPTYTISGTVSGAVSSGVTIFVTGTSSATTTTGSGGTYTVSGLHNGSYTVTPALSGYTFTPTNTGVTVSGASVTNRNFTSAVNSASNASIRLDTTRYGSDTAGLSSSPDPAVGVLATGWIKSTHTAGTYPLSIINLDFWTLRGSNWMLQAVPAATTSSASVAGYTNNIMLFGTAGSSTNIWAADYLLHSDYAVNEATALGWVFCAWHIIVNGSANIVVAQKYRYFGSNTFITDTATIPIATLRSQMNATGGTSNFNSWVPSNASMSFSLGNGLSAPFDLTRVRIYQTAAMPSDAALLAISNNDTADTTAWADYAFTWTSGAPVLTDRSGNGRNLSTSGTLYQGNAF